MKNARQIVEAKGQELLSIQPDATVFEALQRMAKANVGALVVQEGEKLVGIFSERDYARKVVLLGRTSKDTPVRDVMTTKVLCARPENTAEECMAIMTDKRIRHLPVIDHKKVIGIVSIGDVVKETISEQQFIIEQLVNYIHR